jgi:nucleobase:cation symporter-1, NCS1 family
MALLDSASRRDSFAPVSDNQRIFSLTTYVFLWWSSLKPIQLFILGQSFLPPAGALNIEQAIVVVVATGLIVTALFSLNGTFGQRQGLAYAIQLRSSFGVRGARIPAAIRAVPAIVWYGIGSWIGAMAVAGITRQLFGYGNVMFYFVLFQVFQTALAYFGIQTIKWFESVMAVVIFAIMGWMMSLMFGTYGVQIEESWRFPGSWGLPFLFALNTSVGIVSTEMISISDLTRYLENRPRVNWLGHAIGVNPPLIAMAVFGIMAASSVGIWNPIDALMKMSPGLGLSIVLLFFVTMAQITTNLTINILPPALVLMDLTGMRWGTAVVVVSAVATATFPWILLDSANFQFFIIFYSAFLGPILAVMLADYWILHRRNVDIASLFDSSPKSAFWFRSGFNPAAFVSMILGAAIALVFLNYSWLVGLFVTLPLYLILMKTLSSASNR